MTRRLSLGLQFEQIMSEKLSKVVYAKAFGMMKDMAEKVVENFKANREFFNVTGNTFTSFYAVVYYKGKMMYVARSAKGEDSPTRKTLAEGEAYDLDIYYEGTGVNGKPYVGEKGSGGQWGPNLIYGRMGKFGRPDGDWALMCVCPVEYAKYNDKILKTVYQTYEMFPDLFSASVMYVKNATFTNGK